MRYHAHICWLCRTLLAASLLAAGKAPASESANPTNAAPDRIGVYDSRAIAYAVFWGEDFQRQLREQNQAAKAARDRGDTELFQKLDKALAEQQQKIHQQVFSTAPATEALRVLQGRLPEIQKQAGVSRLISKWNTPELKQYPSAEHVDVTDALLSEFKLTDKHLKVIEAIRSKEPVPLPAPPSP